MDGSKGSHLEKDASSQSFPFGRDEDDSSIFALLRLDLLEEIKRRSAMEVKAPTNADEMESRVSSLALMAASNGDRYYFIVCFEETCEGVGNREEKKGAGKEQ